MSQEEDLYAIQFSDLCSGSGSWSMRLVNLRTHELLDHQRCLPGELSKLLYWSGSDLIDWVQHQNRLYTLKGLEMQPSCQQMNLLVELCTPGTTADLRLTPSQKILAERLPAQLQTPAAEVLAFIKLNDHFFISDPARIIFVAGESQYDEYSYLVALILKYLQEGAHPEYVLRTLFDKVGFWGRYGDDALNASLNAIEQILREVHEPSPLTDALLAQEPDVFTCSALLHPLFDVIAPCLDDVSPDFWNETLALSRRMLAGDSVESAVREVTEDASSALGTLPHDDLIHLQDVMRVTIARAQVLLDSPTFKAILSPRPEAESRFDTGQNYVQL